MELDLFVLKEQQRYLLIQHILVQQDTIVELEQLQEPLAQQVHIILLQVKAQVQLVSQSQLVIMQIQSIHHQLHQTYVLPVTTV